MISNTIFHLQCAKKLLSQDALTTLYYSLIHSHLIFAIHIWSCTSMNIQNELAIKQKIAIRIIHNSPYNAHTESLFKTSKILTLKYLAELFKLQFMHQYTFNNLPISFTNVERRETVDHIHLCNLEGYYIMYLYRRESNLAIMSSPVTKKQCIYIFSKAYCYLMKHEKWTVNTALVAGHQADPAYC
jgi:hypothetical protein